MIARTPAQERVYFSAYVYLVQGISPSLAQVARGCGLRSLCTVSKHINALVRRGDLRRERFHRGLSLPLPKNPTPVPYVRSTVDHHLGAVDA